MGKSETLPRKRKIRDNKGELDGPYLILLCALTCAGLLMLISASTPESVNAQNPYGGIIKNCIIAVASFMAMLFVANVRDYTILRKYAKYIYSACLLLMYLTPIIGVERMGAKRWIDVGITFQPSEIMKVAMIVYLAEVLSREKPRHEERLTTGQRLLRKFWPEIVVVLPALGAALQRHLSGALIICAIGFVILVVAGLPKKYIVALGALGGIGAVGLVILEPFRVQRILGYRHPEENPLGNGWQILQSLYAIGSGGLFGLGFGQSRQKYKWLPMASNDYIFAVLCEEFGAVGGIAVMLLFGFFVWRGVRIAINARDMFGSLLAFGVSAMIGLQVVINIAVVTNAIPSTGMQLPFFSSGGTSLLFMMIATGLVLNVSRFQRAGTTKLHKVK